MAKLNFLGGKFHGAENDSGAIVPGGKLYFYEPGTATLKDTYTTSNLDTENTNPVILDSAGRATIWLNGNYKVRFDDADDNTIYTEDNINPEQSTVSGNYNLVLNGTFEDDTGGDGTPDSWDSFTYTPGGSVTRITDDQNHGAASMKFISTGSGGGYLTTTNFFEVSPLRNIEVTFLIQSSVVDVRNVVTVFWYKADQTASTTPSTDSYDDSTTNPTSWSQKSASLTPPSDARYAKLRLYGCHSSDSTVGTTWYDDVIIRLGSAISTLTTQGDLLTRDAAGLARIPTPTGYAIFGSDGTDPSWGVIGLLNYISGLTLSFDADTDHDVLVAVGEAVDSANASLLKLTTAITKQIDTTWAAGDNAGGMAPVVAKTGTFTTSTTAVTGVDSLFTTDFAVGDVLYSDDKAEGRRITNIATVLSMTIESAFTTDVSVADDVKKNGLAPNTVYYLPSIQKTSDGTTDVYFDNSITAANIPNEYTAYRNLGYCWTDSSSNILGLIDARDDGRSHRLAAPISTTSGTEHNVPYIPSWVTKITIAYNLVSTVSGSSLVIQIGDSGGMETGSGYISSAQSGTTTGSATGLFLLGTSSATAADTKTGVAILFLADKTTNAWNLTCVEADTTPEMNLGGGHKALSGPLTQLRFTNSPSEAFDAGSFTMMLE